MLLHFVILFVKSLSSNFTKKIVKVPVKCKMDTESTSNGTISCAKNSKHPLDFFKEISD